MSNSSSCYVFTFDGAYTRCLASTSSVPLQRRHGYLGHVRTSCFTPCTPCVPSRSPQYKRWICVPRNTHSLPGKVFGIVQSTRTLDVTGFAFAFHWRRSEISGCKNALGCAELLNTIESHLQDSPLLASRRCKTTSLPLRSSLKAWKL